MFSENSTFSEKSKTITFYCQKSFKKLKETLYGALKYIAIDGWGFALSV